MLFFCTTYGPGIMIHVFNFSSRHVHAVPWPLSLHEYAVHGYHVYHTIWSPVVGEELTAEREPRKSNDPFVAALKRGDCTVGHVPLPSYHSCPFAVDQ